MLQYLAEANLEGVPGQDAPERSGTLRYPGGWEGPTGEHLQPESDFQGLAVGTYGEISSNVRKMVSIAVEYGYKHLGASILASDLDAVKNSIRRRFHTTIAMASWRGYANMLLGRIQYVGKAYAFNKGPEAVSPRGALGPGGLWFLVMCTLDGPSLA